MGCCGNRMHVQELDLNTNFIGGSLPGGFWKLKALRVRFMAKTVLKGRCVCGGAEGHRAK